MGQYVRWQVIITFVGIALLGAYLSSISIVQTIVFVPAEGGTFREGLVGRPQFLNPLLAAYNPVDQDITALLFEGLTRDDGLGNLEPVLAQDWSVSADGRLYVFTLRQDIRWSDGAPFTSDDVSFTLDLIRSPDFPGDPSWQRLWQSVEIEQVDDYTIRFVLSEPLPSFAYYTTVGILPRHILGDNSTGDLLSRPFNLAPVGSGPFKLLEATDQHILLEANPRYHGEPTRIAQVEFKFYPNSEALFHAFQNREIDGLGQVSTGMLKQLNSESDVRIFSAPLPRYDIVYFNLQQPETQPFFQDNTVRQALLKLLDRQALIDEVLIGQAILANGPILPWSWAYNPHQVHFDYDPPGAIELLEAAGWVDRDEDGVREREGVRLSFVLLTGNGTIQPVVAHYLAQQWQEAGVEVIVEVAGDDLQQRLEGGTFEAALVEAQLFGDPDPYPYWHQAQIESGQNFAGWDNTAASQALEQGRITIDQKERIKHYYEFQRLFADEVPALILYHPLYTYAVRQTVNNVQLASLVTPGDRFRNIQDWYLLTRRVIETNADQRLDKLE